jgi:hypothetical protein
MGMTRFLVTSNQLTQNMDSAMAETILMTETKKKKILAQFHVVDVDHRFNGFTWSM